MSEKVITKQSEYYLEFLKSNPIKGYEYKYFSEEHDDDGKSKIVLTLNVDCETYVFGGNNREEILEEMEKLPYDGSPCGLFSRNCLKDIMIYLDI